MQNSAQPIGLRRIAAILVDDLLTDLVDWPIPNDELTVHGVPTQYAKGIATIFNVEHTASYTFEKVTGRFVESFTHQIEFQLAGLTKPQAVELRKYVNRGALFFAESYTGEVVVLGTTLSPVLLQMKGTTGKKGGDKRGYSIVGQAHKCPSPPIYVVGDVPWFTGKSFSEAFSQSFK